MTFTSIITVKTLKKVPAVKSRLNLPPGKSKSLPGSTFQVNRHRYDTPPGGFPGTWRSRIPTGKPKVMLRHRWKTSCANVLLVTGITMAIYWILQAFKWHKCFRTLLILSPFSLINTQELVLVRKTASTRAHCKAYSCIWRSVSSQSLQPLTAELLLKGNPEHLLHMRYCVKCLYTYLVLHIHSNLMRQLLVLP